ncbi:mannose-1-phosphate guanylyltransferase/mannose-6-phosphate isomerase [Pelomicrobium methylotrophicum]|uniref:mannose-1-phosphate guanylyltransferase n=1 Tax=Pelomicrobium methylotrophicum TaxID=2602750 RepID=A0A5C7EHX1_9PROT|nr:mannose-1-phosphate guanylyltransferase/mannose-6-phosphate isomerase [Pelomicrobium methylotrophicum]TXF10924.1 mannose-1-phosphate guanylyltransferase/mannose-6-phosphate isomerase [Pelomicrobium methylotrophicum]
MSLIPVILCGGAGSRLWPVSREAHPKPFIRLGDGQSLLQKAFLRGANLPDVTQVLTVTNREFFFKTEDELREVNRNQLPISFLLEPFGRNTAAAVAAAAVHIAEKQPGTILLILPSDHLIHDQQAFSEAVSRAIQLARQDYLVTFGVRPNAPETRYGYIEAEAHRVIRFVEKPDAATAAAYFESGRFFWNSGMFCFKSSTVMEEMRIYCPDIIEAVCTCLARSRISEGKGFTLCELNAECFARVPENSIDYAVMEKSSRVAVVPCNIGWSDVGSWDALGELSKADGNGNCVEGEALLHDVENCFIRSDERLIGAVGVRNLVIVDTPDALLVAAKNRVQDVKYLYNELKSRGHEAHKLHRTVHRPWGNYTVLEVGNRYKIKRIVVKPGASLSLQMHYHRSEHWIVVSGMAKVVNGEREMLVGANESTYIPAGHRHRLSNPGVLDLVMIEVQSGEYLGEDDIVRFEDNYGRV